MNTQKFYYDDADYDAQLKRTAAAAYSGAADLGEVLVAASSAKAGDADGWYAAWSAAAGRAEALAKSAGGHRETAAGAWLRAMEYWRQAFFYIRGDLGDARLQTGWHSHRAAFRAALPFLPWSATIAEIPLGGPRMGGYLLRQPGPAQSRPTVILFPGYDSTAESAYSETAWMALARGMNVFMFEGPGQGGMLYDQRVPMRPDFEAALTPALDWLVAQDGVDPARLVLVGRSLGGYLAPRGAAHEPRLAALVCDPGQYEFVSRVKKMLPRFLPGSGADEAWDRVMASDPTVDTLLEEGLKVPAMREFLAPRMATMGAATVGDFLRMQAGYTLEGQAPLIRCPTLMVDCAGDFASQSDTLYAALACEKKTLIELSAESGAGGHCGGLGQQVWAGAVFPWIADALAWRR